MKYLNLVLAAFLFLVSQHGNTQPSPTADPSHISREEAQQAGISTFNFDAADKDKDGKLNLSEWTLLKF